MARKRRRTSQPQPPDQSTPQREERFHAPFHDLKSAMQQTPVEKSPPPAPAATPLSPPAAPAVPSTAELKAQREVEQHRQRQAERHRQRQAEQDQALFQAAMSDVERLPQDPRGRVEKRHQPPPISGLPSDEEASLNELRDLVEGRGAFTIQYTHEYMEGVAPGIDSHLAQRLHQGDFSIQGQLDLHGLIVDEAKLQVSQFLTQAHAAGQRCVRLIHGRGLNSPDNRPVLKESVQTWLSQGRLSRFVLAFATAPANDGGTGATYVLLRKATKPRYN